MTPGQLESEISNPQLPRALYIMIGGFLGAGKTTAVARLARRLADQGLRVGLITNDQGSHLVDTAVLAARGFLVEEIAGGCFCCRFNSLVEAARKLSVATRPDVFIAEPVGSCTDLVATVSYPLRRIYGDQFTIAPLSVVVDPIRALRVFGLTTGGRFSDKVRYIYRKQLEEADFIVINKCDLLDSAQARALRQALQERFPAVGTFEVSARHGTGLESWFEQITRTGQTARGVMDVDYEVYAEGEARLGWLNATVDLAGGAPFDGNQVLKQLAGELQGRLSERGAEVAHLKMTLDADTGFGDLAIINLVRNDYVPELSQELPEPLERGQVIVNIRAETSPEVLRGAMEASLSALAGTDGRLQATLAHLEVFQPGRPQPTHRLATPVS
jgi:G3E family GTPase